MKKLFYENAAIELYYEADEFWVRTIIEPMALRLLSYKEFIKEIYFIRDKSEAWKRLTVIEAGKLAGILEEIA